MFLQVSVCPQGGGGMRGCSGGACVVAPGGMRGCSRGGGVRGFFHEIRSMSGRYASYWNAFLFAVSFQSGWMVMCPERCSHVYLTATLTCVTCIDRPNRYFVSVVIYLRAMGNNPEIDLSLRKISQQLSVVERSGRSHWRSLSQNRPGLVDK